MLVTKITIYIPLSVIEICYDALCYAAADTRASRYDRSWHCADGVSNNWSWMLVNADAEDAS